MDALLTTSEVAQKLRLSPNSVKQLWKSGRLRAVRISERKLRFRAADVDEFLRGVTSPAAPIQVEVARATSRQSLSGPAQPSLYRAAELAWCREHPGELRKFSREWVVVDGCEVIEHDVDPVRAVERARLKGCQCPYVFYVEARVKDSVLMGL